MQPDAAIAREIAGAGEDQVAGAGEAHEGFDPPAEPHAEPRDLRQSARDQRRARVVAEPETVRDAGRDGDDVLHRTAHLDADQVVARVDAQPRAVQLPRRRRRRTQIVGAARVMAVGRPRATSSAKLGPDSTPRGTAGASSSSATWCGSRAPSASNPLLAQTTGTLRPEAAMRRRVARRAAVGHHASARSAPDKRRRRDHPSARSRREAESPAGSARSLAASHRIELRRLPDPERNRRGARQRLSASAVPHAPAPSTAILMRPTTG